MIQAASEPRVELGRTGLHVPPMLIGTWAWGDRYFWGYGKGYAEKDIRQAFETSLDMGLTFFDTAEVYGSGRSERFLGEYAPGGIAASGQSILIATKFFPYPWRLSGSSVRYALERSLRRLNTDRVDLYQIHSPYSPRSVEVWAEALGEVVKKGLTLSVGVSNYSLSQMKGAHTILAKMGIPLASNQVEYSLIQRAPERNGIAEACREMDITLLAYSPLGKGVLTGKYTPQKMPPGMRGRMFSRERMEKIQELVRVLQEVGRKHGGKTPAQVALNWTICKGSIPIAGAKNADQVLENAGGSGWRLDDDEVAALDRFSEECR